MILDVTTKAIIMNRVCGKMPNKKFNPSENAMCLHSICPSRFSCARHSDSGTKPCKYQLYLTFFPYKGKCDHFIQITNLKLRGKL